MPETHDKNVAAAAGKPAVPGRETAMHPYGELRRQMDRLLDDFLHGWPAAGRPFGSLPLDFARLAEPLGASRGSSNLINVHFDVSESEDAVEITAELPGIEESDVELTLADGVMTIKGEKKAETEEKKKDYHLSERHYGSFVRSFRLPDTVDEENVKATFDKGVLAITLAKRAEAKQRQRKISISSA